MIKWCKSYIQARWEWLGASGVSHYCTALTKESAPSTDVQQPLSAIAQLAAKFTSDLKLSPVEDAAVWMFTRWVEQQH